MGTVSFLVLYCNSGGNIMLLMVEKYQLQNNINGHGDNSTGLG